MASVGLGQGRRRQRVGASDGPKQRPSRIGRKPAAVDIGVLQDGDGRAFRDARRPSRAGEPTSGDSAEKLLKNIELNWLLTREVKSDLQKRKGRTMPGQFSKVEIFHNCRYYILANSGLRWNDLA
jgi:hypothetical protein